MKGKIIDYKENGTDFYVCLSKMEDGRFVVTTYDVVERKHSDPKYFVSEKEARDEQDKRNEGYSIDECSIMKEGWEEDVKKREEVQDAFKSQAVAEAIKWLKRGHWEFSNIYSSPKDHEITLYAIPDDTAGEPYDFGMVAAKIAETIGQPIKQGCYHGSATPDDAECSETSGVHFITIKY